MLISNIEIKESHINVYCKNGDVLKVKTFWGKSIPEFIESTKIKRFTIRAFERFGSSERTF